MLILTRRPGESIIIKTNNSVKLENDIKTQEMDTDLSSEKNNDLITITVLGVKGNQIRVGIDADKGIIVHRKEIFDRIQQEKESEMFFDTETTDIDTDE